MCRFTGLGHFARRFAFLGFALSSAVLFLPPAAQAAYPGANGRVAYESNQGGADTEIMSGAYDGSGSTQLTDNTVDDKDPAWSPDGKKIAFSRFNSSTGVSEIWTMNADGSGQTAVVTVPGRNPSHPTWKPDGSKIAFTYDFSATDHDLHQADSTGLNSNIQAILQSTADELDPAWSPVDATKILYARAAGGDFELRTVTVGTGATTPVLAIAGHSLTQPAWSPDGTKIAFQYRFSALDDDVWMADSNGANAGPLANNGSTSERRPAWAPEGNMVTYDRPAPPNTEIFTANPTQNNGTLVMETRGATTDTNPDWQPITTAQVRPKGATPLYLPLTIAFRPCASPNATHDPPLSFGSCTPPLPRSPALTVGEPSVNGKPANFVGSIKVKAQAADASLKLSMSDVRCDIPLVAPYGSCAGEAGVSGALSDYTGNLKLEFTVGITDRANPGGAAGTLQDVTLALPGIPCSSTADATTGSTCAASTTFNAVVPGVISLGKRASWEFRSALVKDAVGGAFAAPGTFQP